MSNPAFKVIQDRPLPSGLHTPHRTILLFCLRCKGSQKYLSTRSFNSTSTRAKVTSILRTIFQRLGIPTELYSSASGLISISFRIRAATTAAEAGLPPWLIQTLGRWSSNCFTLYMRTLPSVLQKVPSWLASSSSCRDRFYIKHIYWTLLSHIVIGSIWDIIWVHTCHFPCMLQAGWGSRPTLAFTYTRVGTHLTRWLIHTLQGV